MLGLASVMAHGTVTLPSDDEEGPDLDITTTVTAATPRATNAVVVPRLRAKAVVVPRLPAKAVVVPRLPSEAVVVPRGAKKRPAAAVETVAAARNATGITFEFPEARPAISLVGEAHHYRVLELFSGTGSVGEAFRALGHEVVSLDITDAGGFTPTHKVDVLRWNYTMYPARFFHVVWASPPCEHYSRARTTATLPRDLQYYDALVARTREIVEWSSPTFFFIENPATGLLKTRGVVAGLDFKDVDYCKYGAPYQKRTRIWGRFPPNWVPRPLCLKDCPACGKAKRHCSTAQRGSGWSLNSLHRIPPSLLHEIVTAIG